MKYLLLFTILVPAYPTRQHCDDQINCEDEGITAKTFNRNQGSRETFTDSGGL